MITTIELVTNALNYYDVNKERFSHFFNSIAYVTMDSKFEDNEHDKITFYDCDLKVILVTRYEILGIYDNLSATWIWGWASPQFKKPTVSISTQILNYGLNLPYSVDNYLKTELITSRFTINIAPQIDIHTAIALYLSKKPLVFNYILGNYKEIDNKKYYYVKEPGNSDKRAIVHTCILLDYDKIVLPKNKK